MEGNVNPMRMTPINRLILLTILAAHSAANHIENATRTTKSNDFCFVCNSALDSKCQEPTDHFVTNINKILNQSHYANFSILWYTPLFVLEHVDFPNDFTQAEKAYKNFSNFTIGSNGWLNDSQTESGFGGYCEEENVTESFMIFDPDCNINSCQDQFECIAEPGCYNQSVVPRTYVCKVPPPSNLLLVNCRLLLGDAYSGQCRKQSMTLRQFDDEPETVISRYCGEKSLEEKCRKSTSMDTKTERWSCSCKGNACNGGGNVNVSVYWFILKMMTMVLVRLW